MEWILLNFLITVISCSDYIKFAVADFYKYTTSYSINFHKNGANSKFSNNKCNKTDLVFIFGINLRNTIESAASEHHYGISNLLVTFRCEVFVVLRNLNILYIHTCIITRSQHFLYCVMVSKYRTMAPNYHVWKLVWNLRLWVLLYVYVGNTLFEIRLKVNKHSFLVLQCCDNAICFTLSFLYCSIISTLGVNYAKLQA